MTKVCQITLEKQNICLRLGYVERWKEHCSNPYKNNKIMQINLKHEIFLHITELSPAGKKRPSFKDKWAEHLLTWGKYQVWYKLIKNYSQIFQWIAKGQMWFGIKVLNLLKQRYKKKSNALQILLHRPLKRLMRKIVDTEVRNYKKTWGKGTGNHQRKGRSWSTTQISQLCHP